MEAMDEDKRVLSREQLRAKNEEHTAGKGKLRELTTVSNGMYGLSSTFSDVDGDGWLDLLVAADFGSSNLWWNNGDGTFTHDTTASGVGIDQNGMGSSVGRTFTEVAKEAGVHDSGWAWGSVLTDYDHDGDLDLACTAGYVMYETTFEDGWNCTRAPSSLCTVSCVLTAPRSRQTRRRSSSGTTGVKHRPSSPMWPSRSASTRERARAAGCSHSTTTATATSETLSDLVLLCVLT